MTLAFVMHFQLMIGIEESELLLDSPCSFVRLKCHNEVESLLPRPVFTILPYNDTLTADGQEHK